ncbi:MAG: V-type ATP synthase subunit I [Oscillospiraceae bacterium]|nr:V-type ATP synthase subunit I [Oscillospiraceae bacterium]
MKKFRLIAMRSQKDEIFRELMLLGCVEVSDALAETRTEQTAASPVDSPPDAVHGNAPVDTPERPPLRRFAIATEETRAEVQTFTRALEILDRCVPQKTAMFAPLPEVSEASFLEERAYPELLRLANEIESRDNQLRHLEAEAARERSRRESFLPWAGLSLPLDFTGTKTTAALIGSVPGPTKLAELERAVYDAVPEARVYEISASREARNLLVLFWREAESALGDALRAFGFSASAPKDVHTTASEALDRANARLAQIASERENLLAQIEQEAPRRGELRLCHDLALTKTARDEAMSRLTETDATVTLTGWVSAPMEGRLLHKLSKYDCAWTLSDPAPEEYPEVPIQLKNNFLTRPLTMVTEMYSYPAYGGVDPNPLMAPFFILFYGIMMADMGYGLLMAIGALLAKRGKPRGGMANFMNLLLLCGVATFAVGILTGSFFGDFLVQFASLLGYTFTLPYIPPINPLADTTMLLYAAIALGGLQILVGMAISFVKQTKDGHFLDALFDVGSWWLLFAGIALGALGMTWYVAVAGAAALILTQGRKSAKLPGKLVGGIASLYNITGYFGDALSYARLMALMLAGGAVATAFNQIGAMTGNVITFVLISIVGNALNLGLNLIGCFVHDLRLQCLEYMGKFYQDGGRAFAPLKLNAKYHNIVKD